MINKNTTVRQFLALSIYYDLTPYQSAIIERGKPDSIAGYKLPETLDSITYGQRLDLQEMKTETDMLFTPCEVLFKMTKQDVLSVPIFDIAALSKWVVSELNRMTERENKTLHYMPSPEEVKAGINTLRFGAFGVIDSIVKTRPVYKHEEVLGLSCAKVYAMQLIDHKQTMYEKKLREQFSK